MTTLFEEGIAFASEYDGGAYAGYCETPSASMSS